MQPNYFTDYIAKIKITDKYMKPSHLNFTETKERVSFIEEVDANGFETEEEAKIFILSSIGDTWDINKYWIDILSINEKKIQMPRLIV